MSVRLLSLLLLLPMLWAWVSPVDFTADNTSVGVCDIAGIESCIKVDGTVIYRCDTPTGAFGVSAPPQTCHRWNLIWEPIATNEKELIQQIDWNPEVGGTDWRLPTVKELMRLVTYNHSKGFTENPLLHSWITGKDEKGWLISSTFRDIDGQTTEVSTGRAQVLAVKIIDGQVLSFEPGQKSTDGGDRLMLCQSLLVENQTHPSDERGDCILAPDNSHEVFALKVRTATASDLM